MGYEENKWEAASGHEIHLLALTESLTSHPMPKALHKSLPCALPLQASDLKRFHASVCGENPFDYCAYPT